MSCPLVVCVILNTNRREDTLDCLQSLAHSTYGNLRTVVLDNASVDGSVEAIRTAHADALIVELPENGGYAGNNNFGIGVALELGAEWVFVLNEDTVLANDCVERLVEIATGDGRIGIVGPMVYHHDEPDVIQSAGGRLGRGWSSYHLGENVTDCGQFRESQDTDWISGCALMVHRCVIEHVGMLDPRYFYYWEETEWCMRAARAGWRIVHVPQAKVWHKGVQRNYRPTPQITYYATRNRLLTLSKHRAPLLVWTLAWLHLARTAMIWTVKPKWRAMRAHRHAMLRGAFDFLRGRLGGPVHL